MVICQYCGNTHKPKEFFCPITKKPLDLGVRIIGEKLLERYIVKKIIGEGPLGIVAFVEDSFEGKEYAAKIIHPQYAKDIEVVSRFLAESKKIGTLSLPNIARVIMVGKEESGAPVVIREYIEGKALNSIIKENGRLNLDKAINILKQVAQGLSAALSKGVLNLDLTPGDIFIEEREEKVKLVDFGESHIKYGEGIESRELPYAAPEQREIGGNIGPQADVWACGLIFLEMITGKNPCSEKIQQEDILRVVETHVPEPFTKIIKKALSIKPEERYPSVIELLYDIERAEKENILIQESQKKEEKKKRKLITSPIPLITIKTEEEKEKIKEEKVLIEEIEKGKELILSQTGSGKKNLKRLLILLVIAIIIGGVILYFLINRIL